MDSREILDLENKLLDPTAEEPISLPLNFLRSITNCFSNEQELGRGGYGVVYKGLLRQGDSFIAVKKFHNSSDAVKQGDEQFQKVATSLIKHPNVIQLLGYCAESKGVIKKQENGKRAIVYEQTRILCFEYMCNGGLDKHLSDESSGLEWNMRYKIIKEICHGLDFLHGCNIIHLDLKPQNILMDATMMPKIADFDLARLLGEQKSQTVTNTANPPGTRGYMAPEYIDGGVISKKADIFSLGVIIIEILKGCKDDYPDYRLSTEIEIQHFTEKVLSNWRNRFERSSKYTALELHTQQVKQCINIALECVHHEKEKRPNLSNIIENLNVAEESCVRNGEDLPVEHQIIQGWEKDHLRGNTSYRNFGENQPSKRMEKDITPISELRLGRDYKICVRVSRMWEFRGKSEQSDIKHVDLVLIDQKGDSIYAEIPPDAIPCTPPYLKEGNIVYITKIVVRGRKYFKAVPNPYMLKLNMRTTIVQLNNDIPGFPKYTFSLIPLDKLGDYVNKTEYFLDVIGKIVAVSNASTAYSTSGEHIPKRSIKLQDLRGNTIDLSLFGKRALEFDGETVLDVGQKHHVIAIFVGTLMKTYGQKYTFLSGTTACRWYINENDIPEIKSFQKSLIGNPVSIQRLYLQNEDDALQNLEEKSLIQLKEIDPFVQKGQKYQCTVTIIGIKDDQPWCYRACTVCNSWMIYINPRTNKYQCSKEGCPCSQFEWKYKIAFIGTDETYRLGFVLFEKKGSELIGKSAEVLRKQYEQRQIPSDISAWIGFKLTFVVIILANKSADNVDPSFEVIMIKKNHGKQSIVTPIRGPAMALAQSSSSSIAADTDLPPLITIASKKLKTEATSSQTQVSSGIQDMDIEPPGIWQQDDNSDKRNFEEIDENNQKETETYSDIYHHKKSKKKKQ